MSFIIKIIFKELGLIRSVLLGLIMIATILINRIALWFDLGWLNGFISTPWWITIGVIVVAIILINQAGKIAKTFSDQSQPTIRLTFENDGRHAQTIPWYSGESKQSTGNALWLRVSATNTGEEPAKNCKAILLSVWGTQESCGLKHFTEIDPLQLNWSNEENGALPVDLVKDIPHFADVFSKKESKGWLDLEAVGIQYGRFRKYFSNSGIYEFEIKIVADNAQSEPMKLRVEWDKEKNKIEVNGIKVTW